MLASARELAPRAARSASARGRRPRASRRACGTAWRGAGARRRRSRGRGRRGRAAGRTPAARCRRPATAAARRSTGGSAPARRAAAPRGRREVGAVADRRAALDAALAQPLAVTSRRRDHQRPPRPGSAARARAIALEDRRRDRRIQERQLDRRQAVDLVDRDVRAVRVLDDRHAAPRVAEVRELAASGEPLEQRRQPRAEARPRARARARPRACSGRSRRRPRAGRRAGRRRPARTAARRRPARTAPARSGRCAPRCPCATGTGRTPRTARGGGAPGSSARSYVSAPPLGLVGHPEASDFAVRVNATARGAASARAPDGRAQPTRPRSARGVHGPGSASGSA